MNAENRLRKFEERLNQGDRILPCLMGLSAEDMAKKIADFEEANPGKPYALTTSTKGWHMNKLTVIQKKHPPARQ